MPYDYSYYEEDQILSNPPSTTPGSQENPPYTWADWGGEEQSSTYIPGYGTSTGTTSKAQGLASGLSPYAEGDTTDTAGSRLTQQPVQPPLSQTRTPIGETTRTIVPRGLKKPEMGALPSLVVPEIDEARISSIARDVADPYLRKLRSTTQTALSKQYDNQMVASMNRRNILAGMGESLASVLSSARREGRAEEASERQMKYNKAQMEYQAQISRQNMLYQSAYQEYLSQMIQESRYIYPEGTLAESANVYPVYHVDPGTNIRKTQIKMV